MNKRPAYEQVTIAHGGRTVTLRPSLRAATILEARFGFPAMFRALDEGSFTMISEIILTASSPQDAAAFLAGIPGKPLSSFIAAMRIPLAELVSMLMPAPIPRTDSKPAAPTGKSVAWADFYASQFEQATGWLGWTPEQVWNATPTEIDRAYSGHIAKLKAIHNSGGNDKQANEPDPEQAARNVADGLDPEFDRNALRALKAKMAGGA
jgi:hypothetical protein